jgi:hypothetical protein
LKKKIAVGRGLVCLISLLTLLLLQHCQPAWAADWYIVPKIELLGEYDTNINFTFEDKESDFIFNINPSVELSYESNISKLTGRLAWNGQLFMNNSNLNTINQYYSILGQHRVLPRLALTFDGQYTRDETLREELEESGSILSRSARQAIRARPGFIYDLTPRASLGLYYGYRGVTYQEEVYSPYYEHEIGSNLRYILGNQKTTLLGTVRGRYTDYYTIGNSYRLLGTYAGVEHKFSEEWILRVSGGLNYNWYSTQTAVIGTVFDPTFIQVPLGRTEKTSNITPYFDIGATRRWPKTQLTAYYSLDQSPSSSGETRQFHRVNAEITRKFWERLSAGFGVSSYYGSSTEEDQENDYQTLVVYLSPKISYQLTERLSLNSSYIYGWRNDIDENATTDRHRIWVYLTFAYPIQYKK